MDAPLLRARRIADGLLQFKSNLHVDNIGLCMKPLGIAPVPMTNRYEQVRRLKAFGNNICCTKYVGIYNGRLFKEDGP